MKCSDNRYGKKGYVLLIVFPISIVLLFFSIYCAQAVIPEMASGSSAGVLFFGILSFYSGMLSLLCVFLLVSGARTIRSMVKTDIGWELYPFLGKKIVRRESQLELINNFQFSRWERFFKVTSLLSRTEDNFAIRDSVSGKVYYSNSEYLNSCLKFLF